jgi:hypothetical protein
VTPTRPKTMKMKADASLHRLLRSKETRPFWLPPPPPADSASLARALALLGQTVPEPPVVGVDTDGGAARRLHLARVLAAAAEQQVIAAETALAREHGGTFPAEHTAADHQGGIDLAASGSALMMLALVYWRADRLATSTQALADAFIGADTGDDQNPDDNPVHLTWELAVPAATGASGLLRFLAGVTTDDGADSVRNSVQALDAATGLLVLNGRRAQRLRSRLGMERIPDLFGADSP